MKRLVCFFLCFFMFVVPCDAFAATKGEQNALATAKSYLSFTHFSYTGLIDQLEYDGYSSSECQYAADNCGADWYDQAAGSASSYMSLTSFSKKALVEQLEYDGYTKEEAEYGAAVAYDEDPIKPNSAYVYNSSDSDITDSSFVEFEPTLTEVLDHSATEWFTDDLSRAFLSILISLDYANSFGDSKENYISPDYTQCSYVGRKGFNLVIVLWSDKNVICITYIPIADTAQYYVMEVESVNNDYNRELVSELLLNSVCDEYHKNDLESLVYVAKNLTN